MSTMQPLTDEHRDLLPHVERLRAIADRVGGLPTTELRTEVAAIHRFLTHHLIPHAEAEDAVLYPAVARVMGAGQATATMSRDHVEVGRLTADLADLRERDTFSDADLVALRRVLYGLHALVSVHFAKEEEIYVPLLAAALSPEEADSLLRQMAHAAHDHGHA